MAIVAGVDFGTLSVRVTLVDSEKGPIGTASAYYPLHRRREDPELRHAVARRPDGGAGRGNTRCAEEHGRQRQRCGGHCAGYDGIERDSGGRRAWSRWTNTTCGAIIAHLPRPRRSRARRTSWGSRASSGAAGVYSHEWGFAKLLHWLRHNPEKRARFVTALEHCDMAAATLCGMTEASAAEAQRVRHGPQVDVESEVGRAAAGGVSGRRRSAACRRAREDGRRVPDQRPPGRAPFGEVGARSWGCARGFRFRWAHSTRTGMRSARTSARATR